MTPFEHRLLLLVLGAVLLSVPLAVLAFRFVFPRPHSTPPPLPVIPPADAEPAGSFLDLTLPRPHGLPAADALEPETPAAALDWSAPAERGVAVRHWKWIDGVTALILTALLCMVMGPLSAPEGDTEMQLTPGLLVFQLLFQFGIAGLVLLYLRLRGMSPVRVFGFRRLSAGKTIGFALIGFVVAYAAVIVTGLLMMLAMGDDAMENASKQLIVDAIMKGLTPLVATLTVLSLAVGAPVMEEVVFRGFLYPIAKRFTHPAYALPAVAIFFAVVHANAMSLLPLTVIGLVLAAAYELTRSLTVPMIIHGLFNLAQSIMMFYAKDLEELQKALQSQAS